VAKYREYTITWEDVHSLQTRGMSEWGWAADVNIKPMVAGRQFAVTVTLTPITALGCQGEPIIEGRLLPVSKHGTMASVVSALIQIGYTRIEGEMWLWPRSRRRMAIE
jgi:hypothetical protein